MSNVQPQRFAAHDEENSVKRRRLSYSTRKDGDQVADHNDNVSKTRLHSHGEQSTNAVGSIPRFLRFHLKVLQSLESEAISTDLSCRNKVWDAENAGTKERDGTSASLPAVLEAINPTEAFGSPQMTCVAQRDGTVPATAWTNVQLFLQQRSQLRRDQQQARQWCAVHEQAVTFGKEAVERNEHADMTAPVVTSPRLSSLYSPHHGVPVTHGQLPNCDAFSIVTRILRRQVNESRTHLENATGSLRELNAFVANRLADLEQKLRRLDEHRNGHLSGEDHSSDNLLRSPVDQDEALRSTLASIHTRIQLWKLLAADLYDLMQ
jgi:hypothetical protein